MSKVARTSSRFYVGATIDPVRRWLGDAEGSGGRGPMPGHMLLWDAMFVLDIFPGKEAAQVEKSLILFAKHEWPDRCANLAGDARGLPRNHPAFIYICLT